jgi:hypothetical protein
MTCCQAVTTVAIKRLLVHPFKKLSRGPGSSVGIATELAGRSGDRIPVVARFSALVQTGPGTHPASRTMGTGSFPGVESGRGVTTPHPLLVPRSKNRVELYLYSPYGPSWPIKRVKPTYLKGYHKNNTYKDLLLFVSFKHFN